MPWAQAGQMQQMARAVQSRRGLEDFKSAPYRRVGRGWLAGNDQRPMPYDSHRLPDVMKDRGAAPA